MRHHRSAFTPISDPAEQLLQRDALFDLRHQGSSLKGSAFGEHGEVFLVRVHLDRTERELSCCTCPTRHDCTHITALRRLWERSREAFTEIEDLASALQRTPINAQIELFDEILRRHPELDALVDTKLGITTRATAAPEESRYRRQVDALFEQVRSASMREEPEALHRLTVGLDVLFGHAKAALRRSNVLHAASIFVAIAKSVDEHSAEITSDEHESIHDEGRQAARSLGLCLDAASDDQQLRRTILRMMLDVAPMDSEKYPFAEERTVCIILARETTPEERRFAVSWILDKLRIDGDELKVDRAYMNLLLDVGADGLADTTFAQACRCTGRLAELVSRLLRSGRIDEAIAEMRSVDDRKFPTIADEIVRAGHAEIAKTLAMERLGERNVLEHLDWLRAAHESEGRHAEALPFARRAFLALPTLEAYKKTMSLAATVGTSAAVKRELREELLSRERFDMIAEIELADGNLDEAMEMIERAQRRSLSRTVMLEIARAAEATRPQAALRLYAWEVAYLVEIGAKRSRYRDACEVLARMKAIHLAMGDVDGWKEQVAAIRHSYGAKRALLEELAQSGL